MKAKKLKVESAELHSVNVRFKGDDYQFLKDWAQEEMQTVGALVRSKIMEIIKERKKQKT